MTDEEQVMKGGHAPAEKIAGGVRIARKPKSTSESEKGNAGGEKPAAEERESLEVIEAKNVLAHTGLAALTNKEHPAEAVRAYHEKPLEQYPNPNVPQCTHLVFQPRKQ